MNRDEGWHPSIEQLQRLLDGCLTSDERDQVKAHVNAGCPDCEEQLERLGALTSALRAAVRAERVQPPPPHLPGFRYDCEPDSVPSPLGLGGFGVVYPARRLETGERVAVKFLQTGTADSLDARRWFVDEAQAALQLHHPAIVRGLDFGAAENRVYYVMEFVAGKDLLTFQDGKPLLHSTDAATWAREVAGWLRLLADALRHAHNHFIIHRDLSPKNVLVQAGPDGSVKMMKICDFGLVRRLDTSGQVITSAPTLGLLAYAAPEQFNAQTAVGPFTDLYALGALGYFMLTGKHPFPLESQTEMLHAIQQRPPLPPSVQNPNVPRDLETIILTLLRKHPRDRYARAEEVIEDLDRFQRGQRLRHASRSPRWDRTRRWWRQVPALIRALSAAVLLLLALVFGLFLHALEKGAQALFEKGQAVAARQDAEREALRASTLAFHRLVDAARFARRNGQLTAALPLYDQVVALAPEEVRVEFEVERLRCLFTYGNWTRLQADLDRLGARTDLPPPLKAEVLLHRGDLRLLDAGATAQNEARKWLGEALAIPAGLGPADTAYARGLLAEGVASAVRHFEGALQSDRFHLRAGTNLLVELLLSGQLERARQQADFLEAVFPEEPAVPLARALVAVLQDDNSVREKHVARLRKLIDDPTRLAVLERALAASFRAVEANRRRQSLGPAAVEQLVLTLDVMRLGGIVGVGLPAASRVQRLLATLLSAYGKISWAALTGGSLTELSEQLQKASAEHPESLLRSMHGLVHMVEAQRRERKGDMEGVFTETRRAHALFEEAAEAPTLIPFDPHRLEARWYCVAIEAGWRGQHQLDAIRLGTAALGQGGLSSPGTLFGTGALVQTGTARLAGYPQRRNRRHLLQAVVLSKGNDPTRAGLVSGCLKWLDPEDARLLLSDWADDLPKDPTPCRLRVQFEIREENYGDALRWTERALALRPRDQEMLRLRAQAQTALEVGRRGTAMVGK